MELFEFADCALSFPGTEENLHFDRRAFKVIGKRIFATLHEKSGTANLKLSPEDQSVYIQLDGGYIYPVPNKWGLQGWTTLEIDKLPTDIIIEVLNSAYLDALNSGKKGK